MNPEHTLDALAVRAMSTPEVAEWLSSYPDQYGWWATSDAYDALTTLETDGRVQRQGFMTNSTGQAIIWALP